MLVPLFRLKASKAARFQAAPSWYRQHTSDRISVSLIRLGVVPIHSQRRWLMSTVTASGLLSTPYAQSVLRSILRSSQKSLAGSSNCTESRESLGTHTLENGHAQSFQRMALTMSCLSCTNPTCT